MSHSPDTGHFEVNCNIHQHEQSNIKTPEPATRNNPHIDPPEPLNMLLLDLPVELLEAIAARLQGVAPINALSQTCTSLHAILTPFLYRYDDAQNGRAGAEAMTWALKRNRIRTVERIIASAPSALKVRHLTRALRLPRHEIFQLIIQAPALQEKLRRSKGLNESGRSVLHAAVTRGPNAAVISLATVGGPAVVREGTGSQIPLIAAISSRHLGAARILLDHGADVNARDDGQRSSLTLAAGLPNLELVEALIEKGADPAQDREALGAAVMAGALDVVSLLLEHVARAETPFTHHPNWQKHMLCQAAGDYLTYSNNPDPQRAIIVQALLDHGADPKDQCTTIERCTPLARFAAKGHAQVIELLLALGADPGTSEKPLWNAVMSKSVETVRLLVSHGANLNGSGLLLQAVEYADSDHLIVECLVQAGADVNVVRRFDGITPLHLAVEQGNVGMARLLLEHGADAHAINNCGKQPLQYAFGAQEVEFVDLFISHGVNVDAAVFDKKTLAALSIHRSPKLAELLITKHGANVNARSRGANTLLHLAARANPYPRVLDDQRSLLRTMIENGGDVNAPNACGQTPLSLLMGVGDGDAERLGMLLRAGADPAGAAKNGVLPFLKGLFRGSSKAAEKLLEHGYDIINMTTLSGRTLLMEAAMVGYLDAVYDLLDLGVDVNAVSDDGRTALDMAWAGLGSPTGRLLRSRGAVAHRLNDRQKRYLELM